MCDGQLIAYGMRCATCTLSPHGPRPPPFAPAAPPRARASRSAASHAVTQPSCRQTAFPHNTRHVHARKILCRPHLPRRRARERRDQLPVVERQRRRGPQQLAQLRRRHAFCLPLRCTRELWFTRRGCGVSVYLLLERLGRHGARLRPAAWRETWSFHQQQALCQSNPHSSYKAGPPPHLLAPCRQRSPARLQASTAPSTAQGISPQAIVSK